MRVNRVGGKVCNRDGNQIDRVRESGHTKFIPIYKFMMPISYSAVAAGFKEGNKTTNLAVMMNGKEAN